MTPMEEGRFGLRVDPERRARWEEAARRAGLPLGTWMKLVCDEAAKGRITVVLEEHGRASTR